MEIMDLDKGNTLERAKRKVAELKGFYVHFAVYLVVNVCITAIKIIRNLGHGESFMEVFWDFGNFAVWLFWGIGLLLHGLKVFSYNPFFNKDWDEKQIRKYMEKEKREAEKYK